MKMTTPEAPPAATFADGWVLYETPARDKDSFLWRKFKLMQPDARKRWGGKRVYRLTWHVVDLRFARDQALNHLMKQPDLFAAVELYLTLNHDVDSSFATAAEIAAERVRLKALRAKHKADKVKATKELAALPK